MADKIFLSGEGLELIMSRFLLCKLANQTLLVLASPLLDLLLVVNIGIDCAWVRVGKIIRFGSNDISDLY